MIWESKNNSYPESQNLKVFGQGKLNGTVEISGAKNSALVLLAASLLTNEKIILENVPRLTDIEKMGNILEKRIFSQRQILFLHRGYSSH